MSRKPPKKPVKFTAALGELICSLLAEGQSLRKICALNNMPHISTVMDWLMRGTGENAREPYKTFAEQYARAREAQAEVLADEIIDIADDDKNDVGFKETEGKDGQSAKPVSLLDNVHRAKLRVDARKWVASKLLPKKYGEKVQTELSTKDDKPIPIFTLDIGQKKSDA